MATLVPRLTLVLALAAIATPALSDTVRRPANNPAPPTSDRGRSRPLSAEELSATAGAGPSEAALRARAEGLAATRKAIDQLLATLPAARRPG